MTDLNKPEMHKTGVRMPDDLTFQPSAEMISESEHIEPTIPTQNGNDELNQAMLDLQFQKVQKKSVLSVATDYIFMWWDGLLFFAFDDTKLARLEGQATKFTDKFKNKKWLITTIIGLVIGTYIIISYAAMIGTEKS